MKFFKEVMGVLRTGIARYVVAFGLSLVLFGLTCYTIFSTKPPTNMVEQLISATVFALAVSILLEIVSQRFEFSKPLDLGQKIVALLSAVPCYFLTSGIETNNYIVMGLVGSILAVLAMSFFFLFTAENESKLISHIVKSIVFCGFIALIIWGGISICIAAVNFLIIKIYMFDRYFLAVYAFVMEVIFLNLLLSYIPRRRDTIELPKAFKVLALYVAFPIYTLLIAVLYVYLGKIVVTRVLPSGQINWFASFALLFFIFFSFTLQQYDNKAISFFKRFGGFLLLPIVSVQAIAVYVRVNAYGLTTARWMSIVLTFVALIFVVVALIRHMKYIHSVIPVLAVAILMTALWPLNAINIPVYEQSARLERILVANKMLENGKVIPTGSIPKAEKIKITSCYDVVQDNKHRPAFLGAKNLAFSKVFGFEQQYSAQYGNQGGVTYVDRSEQWDSINLAGYTKLVNVNGDMKGGSSPERTETITITVQGRKYDITNKITAIPRTGPKTDMILQLDANTIFYISSFNYGKTAENEYEFPNVTGFALVK